MPKSMYNRLLILALALLGGALSALPARAATKTVYVYRDGCKCAVEVPDDTEFFEVECKDIWQGNKEVLNESRPCMSPPKRGYIGGTITRNDKTSPEAEHYGRAGSGPFFNDFYTQRQISAASWQEASGEYLDPHAWNLRLDQSTTRINYDSYGFSRRGFVYGLDAAGAITEATRTRRFYDTTLRFGSMDGGTWRINQLYTETGIGTGVDQAHDARHWRTEAGFKQVECGWLLDSTLYYGNYNSVGQQIDNKYHGWQGEARKEFDRKFSASADADLQRIDVGLENKSVTRSNAGGKLEWQSGDHLTIAAEARRVDEANDVVITSHLKGYTDVGGSMNYHPDSRVNVSAEYRHREANAERITQEDPNALAFYLANFPTQRSDLDALRVKTSASGDFVNLRGRFKLGEDWALGADYNSVNWTKLPEASKFDNGGLAVVDPYFQNTRINTALRLSREFCDGGQLVLDGGTTHRGNGVRDASYDQRRYSAAYSAPLNSCQRYNLGVSRTENQVDLTGAAQDWEDRSWNFDAGLSGDTSWASYNVNVTRQMVGGAWAGDYNSLGVDLRFHNSPLSLSGWWRQRQDDLMTFAHFNDVGLRVGYAIEVE